MAYDGNSGTAGQVLQSQASGSAPTYSTATYPATTTVSQILYSSSTNTVGGITTANNSVVLTNGSGVPSLGTSLTNDFTYTSSTAGATRTLTVSNTDNTNAASKAIILAQTGGASSGDAVFQASTTTTTWSFGSDNSVTSPTADPFVISQGTSLGTNNVMSVATSGEINYPLQCAFSAVNAVQSNVTGDGTVYTMQFTTEIFDQNNDFDATSTFTAPVTGKYHLWVQMTWGGLTASHTTGNVLIVTTARTYTVTNSSFANERNGGNGLTICGGAFADMTAGDTCTITTTVSGGTKVATMSATSSYFFGQLTV